MSLPHFIFLGAQELSFAQDTQGFAALLCTTEVLAQEPVVPTPALHLSETGTGRAQRHTVILERCQYTMQLPSIWKCSPTASQTLCQKTQLCDPPSHILQCHTPLNKEEQRKLKNRLRKIIITNREQHGVTQRETGWDSAAQIYQRKDLP